MNPEDPNYQLELAKLRRVYRLEAKLAALEAAISSLARKCGVPGGVMEKFVSDATEAGYQTLLQQAESVDPAVAAQLDTRPAMPDLPDPLL